MQTLIHKPTSTETEGLVKALTQPQDMGLNSFATVTGIRAQQFGREIFSAVLKFKDLKQFLQVFPEVQRGASTRKINSIKNYVLSGATGEETLRFFSSLTVTTRGHVYYDERTHRVAIDTNNSKLSINDGQHRFYGINAALEELASKANRAKTPELKREYHMQRICLEEMAVPLVIFNQIDEATEKQLFHDLNNLATKPSRNANIRLAQTDLFSRMAREISEESPYLMKYGVEYHKQSIHPNNPNTVLLTTVYAMCRQLFIKELRLNSDFLTEYNFKEVKNEILATLNLIFQALPQDMAVKHKYITSKSYGLRGIAVFVQECQDSLAIVTDDAYKAIANVNWEEDISYWSAYGATQTEKGAIQFTGHGEGGVIAIKRALYRELEEIEMDRKLDKDSVK